MAIRGFDADEAKASIKLEAATQRIRMLEGRIRQQEDQYNVKEQHMLKEITRLRHMEDAARDLCATILSKNRDEMRLGETYTWNSIDSEELVKKAKKSYQEYCKKRTQDMQKVADVAIERTAELERIKERMAKLETDAKVSPAKLSRETKKAINDLVEQQNNALRSKLNGDIIVEENEEERMNVVKKSIAMQSEAKAATLNSQAEKNIMHSRVREAVDDKKQQKEREEIDAITKETMLFVSSLTDEEQMIITAIGGAAMSVSSEIREYTKISGPKFSEATKSLRNKMFIGADGPILGQSTAAAFFLTLTGKQAYKQLTGQYPKESECEKIIRIHNNATHGYSIRALGIQLNRTKIFEKTNMFPKSIDVNGFVYKPDLVAISVDEKGEKSPVYFEFELVKQTFGDYTDKFNKLAALGSDINVVVPTGNETQKMQKIMNEWATRHATKQGYADLTMRLGAYSHIKNHIDQNPNITFDQLWIVAEKLPNFPDQK